MFVFRTPIIYTMFMATKYTQFIKNLRLEKSISQLEIAKKLGISRSSYIAFEQGKRDLSLSEASNLSQMFDISLEEISSGKSAMPEVVFEKSQKFKTLKKMSEKDPRVWERISVPQERVKK